VKGDLPLSPEDVNEIVTILKGSQYDRLDIRTDRYRLRVSRADAGEGQGEGWSQAWSLEDEASPAGATAQSGQEEIPVPEGMHAIRAPLPGVFYRSPAPGTAYFVEVGSSVEAESNVGIIEAMKLFNPVPAACAGEIAEILVENGAMVDAGAILMLVK
jgi:acetyl-CoA carboxylase biotin carboxyl carrier protein